MSDLLRNEIIFQILTNYLKKKKKENTIYKENKKYLILTPDVVLTFHNMASDRGKYRTNIKKRTVCLYYIQI